MLRITGVAFAMLIFVRLVFDGLNFVPAAVCVYHNKTVETCDNTNLLSQNVSNHLNIIGAYLEATSSCSLLIMLFIWRQFHVIRFSTALLKVGHFWLWVGLCSSTIVTVLQVDLTKATTDHGTPDDLGIGLILEVISLTLFASAINFVGRDTVRHYFIQKYGNSRWSNLFFCVYFAILASYFVRNFGLFLYDTALVSMSISNRKSHQSHWNSVLLVFSCAFRGCLFRFFFSKLFQGCIPPKVSVRSSVCHLKLLELLKNPQQIE